MKNLSRILAVEFGRNRELLKNQTQRRTFYSPLMHIRCIPDWLEIPAWCRLYIRDKNPTRMTDDLGKLCNTSPSSSHFKLNLCLLTLAPMGLEMIGGPRRGLARLASLPLTDMTPSTSTNVFEGKWRSIRARFFDRLSS